jgi:hypothetical protein
MGETSYVNNERKQGEKGKYEGRNGKEETNKGGNGKREINLGERKKCLPLYVALTSGF